MVDHNVFSVSFGILGNIISFLVFLAPVPTFYRIYKKKSTESFQSLPYQVALFSCMMWLYYALIKKTAFLLITINSFGCVVEILYISMFLAYAHKKSRARVIRTRSVEFMPFNLSFFLTLSAVVWFSYGVFNNDLWVAVPNVVGFILGMIQMLLYAIYRNSDKVVEEKKVPEETNNSIAGRSKLGSSEVHPTDIDIDTIDNTKEADKENDRTAEFGDHHKSLELSSEIHLDESSV